MKLSKGIAWRIHERGRRSGLRGLCLLLPAFVLLSFAGQAQVHTGLATYYSNQFTGSRTSSGERYNPKKLTAAHAYLPLQTPVRVTNLRNGKSVTVRINDRLPRRSRFMIDLSRRAAQELGMIRDGVIKVRMEILDKNIVIPEEVPDLEKLLQPAPERIDSIAVDSLTPPKGD